MSSRPDWGGMSKVTGNELTLKFPSVDDAAVFKEWFCGGGEQAYWDHTSIVGKPFLSVEGYVPGNNTIEFLPEDKHFYYMVKDPSCTVRPTRGNMSRTTTIVMAMHNKACVLQVDPGGEKEPTVIFDFTRTEVAP